VLPHINSVKYRDHVLRNESWEEIAVKWISSVYFTIYLNNTNLFLLTLFIQYPSFLCLSKFNKRKAAAPSSVLLSNHCQITTTARKLQDFISLWLLADRHISVRRLGCDAMRWKHCRNFTWGRGVCRRMAWRGVSGIPA
jgi:hypothetical protein